MPDRRLLARWVFLRELRRRQRAQRRRARQWARAVHLDEQRQRRAAR